MALQNLIGLLGTLRFGLTPPVAMLPGSASLTGGTAIAWGRQIAQVKGFDTADEVGIAMAALRPVPAAVTGGHIAKRLIDRNGLESPHDVPPIVGLGNAPIIRFFVRLQTSSARTPTKIA